MDEMPEEYISSTPLEQRNMGRSGMPATCARSQTMQISLLPNGRKVIWFGNQDVEIAVAPGGGHIAALRFPGMTEGANPFWQPPWKSWEPEDITDSIVEAEYGGAPEGRLLASILGHSLALDLYGAPSKEEAATGAVTHGRCGVLPWTWEPTKNGVLSGRCDDLASQLCFSRQLSIKGQCVVIDEKVKNLSDRDRPIGWQQHVSFGPPFYGDGFWSRANCDLGSTHPVTFGPGASLAPNSETHWPLSPRRGGGFCDYRHPLENKDMANDFTGYRVNPRDRAGAFVAGNTRLGFALFYIWPRHFFPWLGIWDEKHARAVNPWNKSVSVRAYEFGVSPFPESRQERLSRPLLFDLPTYLMLPASGTLWVRYLLGIFPDAVEAGDLLFGNGAATLVNGSREIARVVLPEEYASSTRTEMIKP